MVLEVNILLNYPDFVAVIIKNAVDLYHGMEKWKKYFQGGKEPKNGKINA